MEPPVARWMLRVRPLAEPLVAVASMEPPVARWMLPRRSETSRTRRGFNGATCCQVDVTRDRNHVEGGGDASMEPPVARWMLPQVAPQVLLAALLQWSHLLPGGCYAVQERKGASEHGFNGATCCQVDVTDCVGDELRRVLASMEPPVARWMLREQRGVRRRDKTLQWSHLLPGGCYNSELLGILRCAASMEPPVARWMLRRGAYLVGEPGRASMEPPVARWMLPVTCQRWPACLALQWSHLLPGGCYGSRGSGRSSN